MTSRRFAWLIGGMVGLVFGVLLGSTPVWLPWRELLDVRAFLAEQLNEQLAQWLPMGLVRFLGHQIPLVPFTLIWGVVGGLVGLGVGRLSRTQRISATVGRCGVWIVGVFAVVWLSYWVRLLFIHPNQPLPSLQGCALIVAAGCVAGVVSWSVGRALQWLGTRTPLVQGAVVAIVVVGIAVQALAFTVGGRRGDAGPSTQMATKPSQVVVVGVDGATWDVLLALVEEGKMPAFARLMREGTRGSLRTILPWKSPIIWTTIATGKRAREHGIHDFTQRDPASGKLVPVSVTSRKVFAIWDIVGQTGERVGVVNWFGGWPAEPVNGCMISDRFSWKALEHRVWPPHRLEELERVAGDLADTSLEHPFPGEQPDGDVRKNVKRVELERLMRLGPHLIRNDQPKLFMIYTHMLDRMHHWFWKLHAAHRRLWPDRWLYRVSADELSAWGNPIETAYQQVDRWLELLLDAVDEHALVMVLSDHGGGVKGPGKVKYDLNGIMEQLGLLTFVPGSREIDWTRTLVYDNTAGESGLWKELVPNVTGRPESPNGQTLPQDSSGQQQWLRQLGEQLVSLRSGAGRRIIKRVLLATLPNGVPNLRIQINQAVHPLDTVSLKGQSHPVTLYQRPSLLSGTHRMNGILLMRGPGIKRGYRIPEVSVLDIAPTLLYALDLPVAADMEGRVLLEAFESDIRTRHPVRWVATYETGSARAALPAQQSAIDEQMLEQLRSLGYIQ